MLIAAIIIKFIGLCLKLIKKKLNQSEWQSKKKVKKKEKEEMAEAGDKKLE